MALTEKQLVALAVSGNNQQLESRDMNIFAKRSVLLTEYAGSWIDNHIFALGWAWTTRSIDPNEDRAEYYPLRCVEERVCFQRVELHPVDAYAYQEVESTDYFTSIFFFTNADLQMLTEGEPIRAENYKVVVKLDKGDCVYTFVEKVMSVETIIHAGETCALVRTQEDKSLWTRWGTVQPRVEELLMEQAARIVEAD